MTTKNANSEPAMGPPKKKLKKNGTTDKSKKIKKSVEGSTKHSKTDKPAPKKDFTKPNSKFVSNNNFRDKKTGKFDKDKNKPEIFENWNEFKKKKKELKLKRRQNKDGFDVIVKAKRIGEELRKKSLNGGEQKRIQLINELHSLLKGGGHYPKFVLAHDTARIVQWLLKYASDLVINQISKELIPVSVNMLQSKYGIHCVKRLLKYGKNEIRSQVIDAMVGHAVKLSTRNISAPVVEYAFSTWATPLQKQYLVQEFYGDLYRSTKDNNVKHLRDTYKDNPGLKDANLGATKANLIKILNKSLLDSGLVQTVLYQYLSECSAEDRSEMISQLVPHIVVISNSKDGAKAAMQCIWYGSTKDRKGIMKAVKEHVVELSKHEHGHATIITLIDCIDDTVLLHKIIVSDLLKNAKDLAINEWGMKVLLWLVTPADSTNFHPQFIKEITGGREASTSKKSAEIRRKEILGYSIPTLLELVAKDAEFCLSSPSLAIKMIAIVKAGSGPELEAAYTGLGDVIVNPEWKVKENENDILGVENAGIHMALKKLAQQDKVRLENQDITFGSVLIEKLTEDTLTSWLPLNRGCFLLVTVFENGSEETQNKMKEKLQKSLKLLKKQTSPGAK
uniref:Protein penguin-like n=1 Tax=Diabrotica virgifera virgifera TaxID=50390 RepID=A0A6P7GEJ8_DIAVI